MKIAVSDCNYRPERTGCAANAPGFFSGLGIGIGINIRDSYVSVFNVVLLTYILHSGIGSGRYNDLPVFYFKMYFSCQLHHF